MPGYQNKSEQVNKLKNDSEALSRHLKIDRMKCSRTIAEMVQYCQSGMRDDPLITPVRENPFKEKKVCNIL